MVQRPIYSHLHQSCGSSKGRFGPIILFIMFAIYKSEQAHLELFICGYLYYTEPNLFTFLGIGL